MTHREQVDVLLTREGAVQIVHARELAALIESWGYTDHTARERGFPDIFSLAAHLFARLQQNAAPDGTSNQTDQRLFFWAEARHALRKFALSMAYAVPWMVMLTVEYCRPDVLRVSPEMGGALSLALMGSLITAGGFVQMISHAGTFYYGLKEPALAHRICFSLVNVGLTVSVVVAVLAMMTGSYFRVFTGNYLVLSALDYLALSILWMLCAVLSVQGIGWSISLIFLLSLSLSGLMNFFLNLATNTVLIACPLIAVFLALVCVLTRSYVIEKGNPQSKASARPRTGVLSISLVRFFVYGTLYFSFLFADRLTAGSAVPWVSGLSFGLDADYKRGTDLVLLAFLITAALVEYLTDAFLRFWQRLAAKLPQAASETLRRRLWERHTKSTVVIVSVFIFMAGISWFLLSRLGGMVLSPKLLQTAVFGGVGYLMLSVALQDIIILASVDAISMASLAAVAGLAVNLFAGYVLSHLWGVQYAAVGLLLGSSVVVWISRAAVRRVFRDPDYFYSIS